jgi:biotin carboxylase
MGGSQPLLVIIATGGREYREYLLKSIGAEYRVHLLVGAEPTWEREYIESWSVLDSMGDTVGADEMVDAVRAIPENVDGVLTWDEARVLQAAKVAAALGLPGGDPDMVLRCRDKHLTRRALAAVGVPQPQSVLVTGADEALAVAKEIGYPVVLKPRALAASLGVIRVDTPDDLAAQFAFARDTTVPGAWEYDDVVLVEEYLTGPEISVDSAVHRGDVLPMFLARKEVGYAPYFEEVGHVVDAADPLLTDDTILKVVRDTHTALGFTDGMTHTELKLTPRGPKVIEVNARLGGDMIPYLGLRATGMDPGLAAAAVACGRRPAPVADRRLVGAVRFFYVPKEDMTIESIGFERVDMPAAIDLLVVRAKPGEVMSPPPKGSTFGRIAFATAVAETVDECREALDAAERALTVT